MRAAQFYRVAVTFGSHNLQILPCVRPVASVVSLFTCDPLLWTSLQEQRSVASCRKLPWSRAISTSVLLRQTDAAVSAAATSTEKFYAYVDFIKCSGKLDGYDKEAKSQTLQEVHDKARALFLSQQTAGDLMVWFTSTVGLALSARVPDRQVLYGRVEEVTKLLSARVDDLSIDQLATAFLMLGKLQHVPHSNDFFERALNIMHKAAHDGYLPLPDLSKFLFGLAQTSATIPATLVEDAASCVRSNLVRLTSASFAKLAFSFARLAKRQQAQDVLRELDDAVCSRPGHILSNLSEVDLVRTFQAFSISRYEPSARLSKAMSRHLEYLLNSIASKPKATAKLVGSLTQLKQDRHQRLHFGMLCKTLTAEKLKYVPPSVVRDLLWNLADGRSKVSFQLLSDIISVALEDVGKLTARDIGRLLTGVTKLRFPLDHSQMIAASDALVRATELGDSEPAASALWTSSTLGIPLSEPSFGNLAAIVVNSLDAALEGKVDWWKTERQLGVFLYSLAGLAAREQELQLPEGFYEKCNEFLTHSLTTDTLNCVTANQMYISILVLPNHGLSSEVQEYIKQKQQSRPIVPNAKTGDIAATLASMNKPPATNVAVADGTSMIDLLLPDEKVAILLEHRGSFTIGPDPKPLARQFLRRAVIQQAGYTVVTLLQDDWDKAWTQGKEARTQMLLQHLENTGITLTDHSAASLEDRAAASADEQTAAATEPDSVPGFSNSNGEFNEKV